ncbi:MAG: hypothetical protein AAF429_10335 [Pseudomonadota bacterium]
MSKIYIGLVLGSTLLITGCASTLDKASYATNPVQVQTEKGVVTCQLYRSTSTLWDEAIAVPAGMSIQEGDAICQNEGFKRAG